MKARREPLRDADPLPPEDRVVSVPPLCLDTLYREQRPRLLRFLGGRGARDDAGDLVQQAFVCLSGLGDARRAAILDPIGYLTRTIRNLAHDQARREHRQASAVHFALEEVEIAAADQIASLEARDTLKRLEIALLRLKPRTREIFLAHRIDGYSYVEIAMRTGLSVKGVEKHMSRAIAFIDRFMS